MNDRKSFTDTLKANRANMTDEQKLNYLQARLNHIDVHINELRRTRECIKLEIMKLETSV